jgi:hypothetical protein
LQHGILLRTGGYARIFFAASAVLFSSQCSVPAQRNSKYVPVIQTAIDKATYSLCAVSALLLQLYWPIRNQRQRRVDGFRLYGRHDEALSGRGKRHNRGVEGLKYAPV